MIKGRVLCASCILLMIGGTFILYMLLGQSFHFERYAHHDISQSDPAYSTLSETLESAPEVDTRLPDRSSDRTVQSIQNRVINMDFIGSQLRHSRRSIDSSR